MTYLIVYLVIGFIVLAVMFISHRLSQKDEAPPFGELLDAANPERKTLKYLILNNILVPMLAAVLVLAVWPVAIFMKAKELLTKKSTEAIEDERDFAVRREDLQALLSISEIEALEGVSDPLGAVSSLPFGHLHSAWKAFLDGMGPEDAIWSFSAYWTTWGRKELRAGYVAVRGDIVGAHFMTVWKNVEVHAENAMNQRANNLAWLAKQAD